jgi:LysR family transcriptional activator of nhaA
MKWLNYHHLIYFREIARLGSISEASKHLSVGQPALSSQLKSLEESLGVALFERRNRKLILTPTGRVALEYANNISEMGQELLQVIHQKEFTTRTKLRIGVVDAVPKHMVSNILDYAHKKTGCFLTVHEGDPDELLRELTNHHLDIILTDHMAPTLANIFSRRILKISVHAFAPKKFESLKKNFPKSLDNAKVILPTNHSKLRNDLEHFFQLNQIYVDKVAETQDSMLQKILATKGDGVIFLPRFAASEYIKEKKLLRIGSLHDIFVEYYLIHSKSTIKNPAVELLLAQNYEKMKLG